MVKLCARERQEGKDHVMPDQENRNVRRISTQTEAAAANLCLSSPACAGRVN